jgi:predicted PurR-regulated permease PerM
MALIVVAVTRPGYKWLEQKTGNETASSLIMSIIVLVVFVALAGFFFNAAVNQTISFYKYGKQNIHQVSDMFDDCEYSICEGIQKYDIEGSIEDSLKRFSDYSFNKSSDFLKGIGKTFFALFLFVVSMFYLYKSWDALKDTVFKTIPIKHAYKKKIRNILSDTTYAVIYGNFIAAALQAVISFIMFLILGVDGAVLWGMLIFLLAFVPMIGPMIIWLPMTVIQALMGNYVSAIVIFAIGVLVISPIDYILKPKLIGDKISVHPLLVLIGVFGGLGLFGLPGIVIGPILMAILVSFIKISQIEWN